MTTKKEAGHYAKGYEEGRRHVYLAMLRDALRGLGPSPARTKHEWFVEREETVMALRRLCRDLGDNDWPDELHLGDIIEKHVAPHLTKE